MVFEYDSPGVKPVWCEILDFLLKAPHERLGAFALLSMHTQHRSIEVFAFDTIQARIVMRCQII